jgi:hypothetical protein
VVYEIVKDEYLSGHEAAIYSFKLEDADHTLFDEFLEENKDDYNIEVLDIYTRLYAIGHEKGGAREGFFKHNEGKPGDGVCALFDVPGSALRLYCIRYGNDIVVLGGGAPKSKKIRAWQEDKNLTKRATLMIKLSQSIATKIKDKDIRLGRIELIGDLKIEI